MWHLGGKVEGVCKETRLIMEPHGQECVGICEPFPGNPGSNGVPRVPLSLLQLRQEC